MSATTPRWVIPAIGIGLVVAVGAVTGYVIWDFAAVGRTTRGFVDAVRAGRDGDARALASAELAQNLDREAAALALIRSSTSETVEGSSGGDGWHCVDVQLQTAGKSRHLTVHLHEGRVNNFEIDLPLGCADER